MAAILLVDDVFVVRMTLRKLLERGGHSVVESDNGINAIEVLESADIDLIITDIWMPEGDGLELIRMVKQDHKGLPIIAITGGAPGAPTQFSMTRAKTTGADKVFLKPVGRDELLEAIAKLTPGQSTGAPNCALIPCKGYRSSH